MISRRQQILPKILFIFLVELYIINETKCFPNLRYREPADVIFESSGIPEIEDNFGNQIYKPFEDTDTFIPNNEVLIDPERADELFSQEDASNFNNLRQLRIVPYEQDKQFEDVPNVPNQMNEFFLEK